MSANEPYAPDDFDAFWAEVVAEANAVRLDFHRSLRNEFDLPGFVVEKFDFASMEERLNGWLAYPRGARRAPAFVFVPPYGRESVLPNEQTTRPGFATLSLNLHGYEAFHREKYNPARGYFAEGAEDPSKWIFRRMFQDLTIAVRVLQAQIEVDEDRIGAMGLSQGGGMAIWLGAWCPIVKAVVADLPFLCSMQETFAKPVYRFPLKEVTDYMESIPLGRERVLYTLGYFDTMNQATRCTAPTLMSLGHKDPAVRPWSVQAAFAALAGPKRLVEYPSGHDWTPPMVAENKAWLEAHLGA